MASYSQENSDTADTRGSPPAWSSPRWPQRVPPQTRSAAGSLDRSPQRVRLCCPRYFRSGGRRAAVWRPLQSKPLVPLSVGSRSSEKATAAPGNGSPRSRLARVDAVREHQSGFTREPCPLYPSLPSSHPSCAGRTRHWCQEPPVTPQRSLVPSSAGGGRGGGLLHRAITVSLRCLLMTPILRRVHSHIGNIRAPTF